ncbi:hypothetical protein JTB14_013393 [Gonioctena quinquepunctata]|nr:hypothetical protein JTB14_013393 [Gonioctena quinquepunctata]
MSLPSSYTSSAEYLKDSLDFLKKYQWLYNYSNTHVLVNKIFANIPADWSECFKKLSNEELNNLPTNGLKDDVPETLKLFLNTIESLKPGELSKFQDDVRNADGFPHNCGLSEKKLHEISLLAPAIHEICESKDVSFVIDIGSGLGYLSHHLYERYKYNVLGIECSKNYIELAYKNQEKFHPSSKNQVNFVEHFIDEESVSKITELADQKFGQLGIRSCCIVGLHACADLSITILDLFSKLEFAKCMAIMPCCYHRIKLIKEGEEGEYFENFPASKVLMQLFLENEAQKFLKRPFLRLACQQTIGSFTKMTKDEHDKHSRDFMFRAILQEVAEIGKI